uniref:Uncharacterized protein n=1 Tax=Arabidopsis thaliana TaxID=3702 RepID=Q56XJ6_ARATH|nr:hypothetical protein [Arabidopsis thaliana]
MVSTFATPTSLHFPSSSSLSPFPLLFSPIDSSVVNTVLTTNAGALYIPPPAVKKNFAINSNSTCKRNRTKTEDYGNRGFLD